MKLSEIGNPVETLGGIGPATTKQFARLNIFTVADLLSTYPRDYEDRTKPVTLHEFAQAPKVHTICKVTAHDWFGYGRMRTLKIAITDGTANAWLIAFNRPFLEKALPEGCIVAVTGQFTVKYNSLQSTSFEAERLAYDGGLSEYLTTSSDGKQSFSIPNSGVIPVYPLTEGLSQKNFHKAISLALKQYGKAIEDELPKDIIESRHLLHKADALRLIHMPTTLEQAKDARSTLIYEELYHFEYAMGRRTIEHRGSLPSVSQLSVFESGASSSQQVTSSAAGASFSQPGTPPAASASSSQPQALSVQHDNPPTRASSSQPDISSAATSSSFESALSPRQKQLFSRLPFALTADQMAVIIDMNHDVDRSASECNALKNDPTSLTHTPFSMQRLLQGDVGSGKTLVAFFVCLRVIDYGGQCALMAPTELLARQHAENAAQLLEPLDVKVAFLTGNVKAAGRGPLLDALKSGTINILIGTHALFSRNVQYNNLQLAVIDEQHRFGVTQRESIVAKGRISNGTLAHSPNVLMMSATPIPQTLALTVFGDLDVSTIHTMPQGRKSIQTYLSAEGHESNVYAAVAKELAAGHQAYFVYPRISDDPTSSAEDQMPEQQPVTSQQTQATAPHAERTQRPAAYQQQPAYQQEPATAPHATPYDAPQSSGRETLKSAEEMFAYLSKQIYPAYKCALIHSKIDEDEQNTILEDFRANKIQVLVATTVVEVGVDVANATCMVIEHADHFGLAGLHQRRGRVGRSPLQSYCFLVYSKNITETGIERRKALRQNTDGFVIAEEDLKLRGPGEVNGIAQSGYLTLGIADLARDKDMLAIARYDAFTQLQKEISA